MPSKLMGYGLVEFFIYTNPTELLFAFLNLNLFLVLFSITPYLFWTTLDFLRTGLRLHEYNQAKKYFVIIGTILFSSNILLFTILFPIIFRFFKSFNVLESPDIFIKFELKIIEFIYFIYNVFYVINIGLFILLIFIIVISLNGPVFYLKYKKVFLLSNILLATILSTPEVGSQLVLFFILIISLEMLQFALTFIIKVNKVTY